jgi:glucokinase
MNRLPLTVGIDLGATRMKAVVLSPKGEILDRRTALTDSTGDWMSNFQEFSDRILHRYRARELRIGLAAPGLPALDGRSIAALPERLSGIEGLDWSEFLKLPIPVPVLNDAQAALLGEAWRGAARGRKNVILLTLGTGVGGAVICDGHLLRGHLGRAGHLGHISLDPDGDLDVTRLPGSLEDAIGECTLWRRTQGQFGRTQELLVAVKRGETEATAIWAKSVKALAASLASFINLFDPEVIVIGGGIARAGRALFDPLEQWLRQFEWQINGSQVQVVRARLGEWAGAYGAAYHSISRASDAKI